MTEDVTLSPLRIDVGPSDCDVSAPLTLDMRFTLSHPVRGATWKVSYIVDSVRGRHNIRACSGRAYILCCTWDALKTDAADECVEEVI